MMSKHNPILANAALALVFLVPLAAAAEGTPIRYINDWKWEGQAAPLLTADGEGYFAEEGLAVTLDPGEGSTQAIPKIADGEYDLGSATIASLMKYREANPDSDLKAIYIIYNAPPYAVLGRPSLGVTGPSDLEGRTLGAPASDGAFGQWKSFASAYGLDETDVSVEDVSFRDRERKLADGDVDAITGFSFTSYLNLQDQGVDPADISLMLMSDFGLDMYGNAIIVNPEFAEKSPETVRAFLRAVVKGYQTAIENPTAAMKHVMAVNPKADESIELRRLIMAIGYHIVTDEVRANGLGNCSYPRLERSIIQTAEAYGLESQMSATDLFDESFLPSASLRQIAQ